MNILTIVDDLTQSNCYLLEEEGYVIVIDPNNYNKIQDALKERKWIPEIIFLTHEHCDHVGALEEIRENHSLLVVASEACSKGIQSKKNNMSSMMEVYLYFQGKKGEVYPAFGCRPAQVTYDKVYDWKWRGHQLRCESVPGHTLGSSCIRLDEGQLFTGDYLLLEHEVITRLPGGSQEAYASVGRPWLKKLQPGIHIYPGHGKDYILTREGMTEYGL